MTLSGKTLQYFSYNTSESYKHIILIIYSGRDEDSDKKLAEECGADAYVPKILGQDALMEKIENLLNKH